MTDEIAEAIEAACSVEIDGKLFRGVERVRRASPTKLRARLKEFLRNVPEDISVRELLDEL